MKFVGSLGALVAVVTWLAPLPASAAKTTANVTFGDSRSLATTLWYPDNLEIIRGVVVFTGGQGSGVSGDTRQLADNRFWQRFAESLGFGVLGTQFTGSYTDAASGPGMALVDSLASLGAKTTHPELANAPLLLEGFSNGGFFSYTFAAFAPERVIAFCLNKSGFAEAPLDAAFLAVPGFLIWGSEEPSTGTPTVIHALVQQGRLQHALWAELKEWGAQHEEGSVERIFAPFFAEMVAARYPANKDPRAGQVPLLALREADGWIGDHADASITSNVPTIAAYSDYSGDKQAVSWLPSAGLATLWRGFVTQNPITLMTPAAGAQFDAAQALQLSAAGLGNTDSASFLDGSAVLSEGIKPSSGTAKSSWAPVWGGVRGIVALASDGSGSVTRTSRPANVVLYGKDAPAVAERPEDPTAPAADSGTRDAGTPVSPDGGLSRPAGVAGSRAAVGGDAGNASAADGGTSSQPVDGADGASPRAPDAGVEGHGSDAGRLSKADSSLHGSCSCEVRGGAGRLSPLDFVLWCAVWFGRAGRARFAKTSTRRS